VVEGNFIGTDATGAVALANSDDGVYVLAAPNNILGGTAAGAGNVISGNGAVGIQFDGTGASGNVVQGNLVGTDASGSAALGNGVDGIFVNAAPGNTIGGPGAGARNVISANGSAGLQLLDPRSAGNVVQGNLIGTDVRGTPSLGNAYGIFVNNAPRNTLGGPGPAQNLVVGNTRANTIVQTNGSSGPQVATVATSTSSGRITAIVISFTTALDPARAGKLANYTLRQLGKFPGRGRRVPLSSAIYDPVASTVTLALATPLAAGTRVQLTVAGSKRGLRDLSGHLLVGGTNGRPGGSFTTILDSTAAPALALARGSTSTHPAIQHGAPISARRISPGRLAAHHRR
jgi:hypothetical protein